MEHKKTDLTPLGQDFNVFQRLKKKRILLIDDDELIRDSLSLFFRSEGVHVSVYETAERALAELEKTEYDFFIVDYRLPGMDGVEFFKHIKETQKDTLKILITAYKDQKVISEAEKVGIQDIIEKPFTSKTIEQALSALVAKHNKQKRDL